MSTGYSSFCTSDTCDDDVHVNTIAISKPSSPLSSFSNTSTMITGTRFHGRLTPGRTLVTASARRKMLYTAACCSFGTRLYTFVKAYMEEFPSSSYTVGADVNIDALPDEILLLIIVKSITNLAVYTNVRHTSKRWRRLAQDRHVRFPIMLNNATVKTFFLTFLNLIKWGSRSIAIAEHFSKSPIEAYTALFRLVKERPHLIVMDLIKHIHTYNVDISVTNTDFSSMRAFNRIGLFVFGRKAASRALKLVPGPEPRFAIHIRFRGDIAFQKWSGAFLKGVFALGSGFEEFEDQGVGSIFKTLRYITELQISSDQEHASEVFAYLGMNQEQLTIHTVILGLLFPPRSRALYVKALQEARQAGTVPILVEDAVVAYANERLGTTDDGEIVNKLFPDLRVLRFDIATRAYLSFALRELLRQGVPKLEELHLNDNIGISWNEDTAVDDIAASVDGVAMWQRLTSLTVCGSNETLLQIESDGFLTSLKKLDWTLSKEEDAWAFEAEFTEHISHLSNQLTHLTLKHLSNAVLPQIVQRTTVNRLLTDLQGQNVAPGHRYVTLVHKYFNIEMFPFFGRWLHEWKRFDENEMDMNDEDSIFKSHYTGFASLVSLQLKDDDDREEYLNIHDDEQQAGGLDFLFMLILTHLPSLKRLSLSGLQMNGFNVVLKLLRITESKIPQQLTHLAIHSPDTTFNGRRPFPTDSLDRLAKLNLANLESLSLVSIATVGDDQLALLLGSLPKLLELRLNYFNGDPNLDGFEVGITDVTINMLPSTVFRTLTTLKLKSLRSVTAGSLISLFTTDTVFLLKMRVLHLENLSGVTDEVLFALASRRHPGLTDLKLSFLINITNQGVQELCEKTFTRLDYDYTLSQSVSVDVKLFDTIEKFVFIGNFSTSQESFVHLARTGLLVLRSLTLKTDEYDNNDYDLWRDLLVGIKHANVFTKDGVFDEEATTAAREARIEKGRRTNNIDVDNVDDGTSVVTMDVTSRFKQNREDILSFV